ncbi:MAG: hypothetical protein R3B95_07975 [Nitrospirales bacterium]|nr:hypothetical protein [Nitrospirales bacterium]
MEEMKLAGFSSDGLVSVQPQTPRHAVCRKPSQFPIPCATRYPINSFKHFSSSHGDWIAKFSLLMQPFSENLFEGSKEFQIYIVLGNP